MGTNTTPSSGGNRRLPAGPQRASAASGGTEGSKSAITSVRVEWLRENGPSLDQRVDRQIGHKLASAEAASTTNSAGATLRCERRLDEPHLVSPFASARMLRGLLAAEGSKIGRRHVTTLMRRTGIEAIYRRPNTRSLRHVIASTYLLRGLTIDRPNPVRASRHHLHPEGTRLRLSRGRDGLVRATSWVNWLP
jgi:hypothetical protein